MAKTNISMPDALLAEVDRRAAASSTTRSGFIQEAASHYIAALRMEAERAERSKRINHAIDDMTDISTRLPGGPDGAVILRGMRDATPRWLPDDTDADD
jgi:hypothetical protein